MGNRCTPMAESCQCWQKTPQNCNQPAIKINKKKKMLPQLDNKNNKGSIRSADRVAFLGCNFYFAYFAFQTVVIELPFGLRYSPSARKKLKILFYGRKINRTPPPPEFYFKQNIVFQGNQHCKGFAPIVLYFQPLCSDSALYALKQLPYKLLQKENLFLILVKTWEKYFKFLSFSLIIKK